MLSLFHYVVGTRDRCSRKRVAPLSRETAPRYHSYSSGPLGIQRLNNLRPFASTTTQPFLHLAAATTLARSDLSWSKVNVFTA